jgi:glycosyltransferase involved in cell wall biosynthesis
MADPNRPLRILHLTAGSDAGGLSRYIHDLCAAMHTQGHQVAVAGERGAWHWLFEQAPWPWIDAPLKGGPLALRRAGRILRRWLDEHPVDVLHTHYRRATLVARRLQRTRIPILYTVHLSDIALRFPWRLLTDFGDHTHVPSEEAHAWVLAAGVRPEKVTLIHHGIDPDRFPIATAEQRRLARESLGLAEDDLVAVYVGRLDRPKNEDWLLDLAEASAEPLPKLKILLAGQGPHELRLRRRIERPELAERVRLLGHRDPLPVYQAADALLLPSQREGFSFVCAEAMSVGIPVLRTRTAGTAALIVEGTTGRSVEVDRRAFIAGAMDFLADTQALRRMGLTAAQHVRGHFTFDQQLARTIDLYRRMSTLPARDRP